jgi:alpha-L-fucosidase
MTIVGQDAILSYSPMVDSTTVLTATGRVQVFDNVRIQEHISLGQRVTAFEIEAQVNGEGKKIAEGQTIGPRRILRTERVTADAVRVKLTKCLARPVISTVEAYCSPDK